MQLLWDLMLNTSLKYVLWAISKILHRFKYHILKQISTQLKITRSEAMIITAFKHPPISFRVLFDSKTPVEIRAEEVILRISSEGSLHDKFVWHRGERGILKDILGDCEDIPPKGSGSLTFRYALPLYSYWNTSRICLDGFVNFNCLFGSFIYQLNEQVNIDSRQKQAAIEKLKESYKEYFDSLH